MATYINVEDPLVDLGFPPSDAFKVTANSVGAQPNVYVGTDYVSHFPVGAQVVVTTGDQYSEDAGSSGRTDLLIERGIVDSLGADHIILTGNLTGTFNTADNSEVYMVSKYTNATQPSYADLDQKIQNMEDRVDSITHTTWRQRVLETWRNFHPATRRLGYPGMIAGHRWYDRDVENAIFLGQTHILTLDDTVDTAYTGYLGDGIQIWDGEESVEILNAANGYGADSVDIWTYGRNADYWLDGLDGIIAFGDDRPGFGVRAFKIYCRYGQVLREASNAAGFGDIAEATKAFVKAAILKDRRFVVDFPGGPESGALGLQQAISSFQNDAKEILARHTKLFVNTERH